MADLPQGFDPAAPLSNERWERFCHEVLSDPEGKAGQAYERAGYKASGNAAESAAARLFRNVQVAARISHLKGERSERTEVTLDMVVTGLHDEATKTTNPAGARVQAWGLLGKHVGAFEAHNKQKPAPSVAIVRVNRQPATEVPASE